MSREELMVILHFVITLLKNKMELQRIRASTQTEYNRQYSAFKNCVPRKPRLQEVHTSDCWNIFQLKNKKAQAKKQYEAEMAQYKVELVRHDEQLKQLPERYKLAMEQIEQCYNLTNQLIDNFYCMNIINPNYFNLPAICKFYEYLSNELVDSLKEAYRRYEDDKKYYHLMDKMQEIINALDSIRDNQRQLHNVLVSINSNVRSACRSLDNILFTAKRIEHSSFKASLRSTIQDNYLSSINDELRDIRKIIDF